MAGFIYSTKIFCKRSAVFTLMPCQAGIVTKKGTFMSIQK